jgi:hypothetical protein
VPPDTAAVGSASLEIPRGDTCGDSNGRKCESLVGDVTTDAMRTQYGTEFSSICLRTVPVTEPVITRLPKGCAEST